MEGCILQISYDMHSPDLLSDEGYCMALFICLKKRSSLWLQGRISSSALHHQVPHLNRKLQLSFEMCIQSLSLPRVTWLWRRWKISKWRPEFSPLPSLVSVAGNFSADNLSAEPGLTTTESCVCCMLKKRILMREHLGEERQVQHQCLLLVAGAYWVVQELHSLTVDGFYSMGQHGLQFPRCKARPAVQPALPNSSLHHCSTWQGKVEDSTLLLHLENLVCIPIPWLYPLFSASEAQVC